MYVNISYSVQPRREGAHRVLRLMHMTEKMTTSIRLSARWIFRDLRELYSAKLVLNKLLVLFSLALVMTVYAHDIEIADTLRKVFDYQGLKWILHKITFLGDGAFVLILAIAFSIPSATRLFGRAIFSTSLYTGLNVRILKVFLGRPRPGTVQPVIHGLISISSHDSMPSGHSATAFVLAVLLAHRYPRYKVVFYGIATLVAVSRIVENMHWPADVIAGAIIGSLSASLAVRYFQFNRNEDSDCVV